MAIQPSPWVNAVEDCVLTSVLDLALPLFGLILLGFVAGRWLQIAESGLGWLNALILYLALPALIFRTIATAPFHELGNWQFIAATVSATSLVYVSQYVFSALACRERGQVAAIQASAASYGNVGYMGLALAVTVFGPSAAVPAALIFCFDSVFHFTVTPLLVAFGLRHDHPDLSFRAVTLRIVKSIAFHPFILATAAGVAASALHLAIPRALDNMLVMLMNTAAPSALFALGVTLALRKFASIGREFPVIIAGKTVIHPLVAFVAVSLVPDLDPVWRHVAIMMASLPTASNVFILATQYRTYVEGTSSVILVTTMLSALTVPVLLYLAQINVI
jgi:malonate transporter